MTSLSQPRLYNGLNYRKLQKLNSADRAKLTKKQQKSLKQNGYKNVGWEAVIQLHEIIANFREKAELDDLSLEELFLEATRIGRKYKTEKEAAQFQHAMAKEMDEMADLIEQQFPQTDIEVVDFSHSSQSMRSSKNTQSRHQTRYRTLSF